MSFKLKPDMYLIKVVGASKEKIVFSSEHNGAKKILKTTCLCPLDCVHYNMAKNTNYKVIKIISITNTNLQEKKGQFVECLVIRYTKWLL